MSRLELKLVVICIDVTVEATRILMVPIYNMVSVISVSNRFIIMKMVMFS